MAIGKHYCWDACVFISVLTGIGRTDDDLKNLRALAALVDSGDVRICTPTITIIEVLACQMTPEQEGLFQDFLNRSNVEVVSVSRKIAEKAREIRNCYHQNNLEIAVPDSIHLATAIHYEAIALHTYDGCGKRRRKTDLLALDIPLIGKYNLKICKPEPPPKRDENHNETPMLKNLDLFEEEAEAK